ncbi:MAG: hypothetical protein AAGJ32_08125 [Pseudomonadota bacterium]
MTSEAAPKAVRLLVVDFTPTGNGTATGELKAAIFEGLGATPIMQVSCSGDVFDYSFPNADKGLYRPANLDDLLVQIDWFAPTVILARPTPDHDVLWMLALALRRRYGIPVLVWIMDDWLVGLGMGGQRRAFETSIAQALGEAGLGISICDEMSERFEDLFNVPFRAIANGIDAKGAFQRFSARASDPNEPFVFRYAGGLAHNMGVDTLERVADAVSQLRQEGVDVCLEIKTREYWLAEEGERFAGRPGVQATTSDMSRPVYLQWLSEADCNLICYNFDEASHRYVRYSLANKLPELLGVGAPVLGIGPADLPTIARIRDLHAGFHLSNAKPAAMLRCLRDIVSRRTELKAVAKRGRDVAVQHFSLEDMQARLANALQTLALERGHLQPGDDSELFRGFGTANQTLPFTIIANPIPVPQAPLDDETPPMARQRYNPPEGPEEEAPPPRPTSETSGHAMDGLITENARTSSANDGSSLKIPQTNTAGLPLTLDPPEDRNENWLEDLAHDAERFSKTARQRAIEMQNASARTDKALDPSYLVELSTAEITALNGARLDSEAGSSFKVSRNKAAPGKHGLISTGLDKPVGGLQVVITSIHGKVEFTASGETLLSVRRPGTYDVVFRQPKWLTKIEIRCLESMEARVGVQSMKYLDLEKAKQRA